MNDDNQKDTFAEQGPDGLLSVSQIMRWISKTLQLKVPPLMLSTLSFFCSLGRCYRHARCPKTDAGIQRKRKAEYDHLRCLSCPPPSHHHHRANV